MHWRQLNSSELWRRRVLTCDSEAELDSGYSLMEPIGDSLDDLHIHNDHFDDIGMSYEEDSPESEESEEDDREEQEEIDRPILFSDELKGSAFACSTSFSRQSGKTRESPKRSQSNLAPDVYEPAPTTWQDMVTRGTKQRKVPKKEKTIGKEDQKGKKSSRGDSKESMRAISGKEKKKKQHDRANGRGSKSFGYPDHNYADDY